MDIKIKSKLWTIVHRRMLWCTNATPRLGLVSGASRHARAKRSTTSTAAGMASHGAKRHRPRRPQGQQGPFRHGCPVEAPEGSAMEQCHA